MNLYELLCLFENQVELGHCNHCNMLLVYDIYANYKVNSQNDDEFKNILLRNVYFRTLILCSYFV